MSDYSLPPSTRGPVAELAERVVGQGGTDESAMWLLRSSTSAFEARVALFDSAVETLDVQYFIWQGDPSGHMLLDRLLAAADRGVRVRLLVDDLSAAGRDREFYAFAEHPNVRIRIFNPFRGRASATQAMEFSVRFGTLNHRMHNKSIIADGRVGVIGGRNIGDRYFGVYDVFVQHDLDIMFAGPAVADVRDSFDEYWNAPRAVPLRSYLKPQRMRLDLEGLRTELRMQTEADAGLFAAFDLDDARVWLQDRDRDFYSGTVDYFDDSADIDNLLQRRLKADLYEYLASAQDEIVISMAYFIPDEELSGLLEAATGRGVRVVLLTNSVQSNNHMLAHVGYKRSRRRMLAAGVELFELRPNAQYRLAQAVGRVEPGFVGLHTKAAVVDGRHAMIGTANLDPRALDINTEAAMTIDSVLLATELRRQILDATRPENAWQLQLDPRGRTAWREADELRRSEPVRGLLQRIKMFLYVLIPLKDQA